MSDTKHIDETVQKLCDGKITVTEALGDLLGDAGLKAGAEVAVVGDPTYPFDGQKGRIRKVNDNGYADVEFGNGTIVPMQVSLLVPV